MDSVNRKQETSLYSLISIEDFKALLGVDDREDKLARFCLITSTHTIEQYCKRRLLIRMSNEKLEMRNEDLVCYLREYPVRKILAVYSYSGYGDNRSEILEPDFYRFEPVGNDCEDLPCCVSVSPAVLRLPRFTGIKVMYKAGYAPNNVPPDLASACLELAAWNFNRYRSRRVGLTGIVRGAGKDGEHLEPAMPENVRLLLEPYKRKTI